MDLSVRIGKLKLRNPVVTASGTFGFGQEFADFFALNSLGGLTTKTITWHPRQGNPPPRLVETPSGLLNSIGLENDGCDQFISDKLPFLKQVDTSVIVSIAGESKQDFVKLARKLDSQVGVDGIELNISCPNVRSSKAKLIAQDAKAASGLVKSVRKATGKTLIVKLSPNVTDIVEIAQAVQSAGAEGVSLVNTFYGMSIDAHTRKSKIGNIIGGVSGPAIKPLALACVYKVANKLDIPIIGGGGIINATDAIEFIIAGASAVSIGTGNFINPFVSRDILKGIKQYLVKHKIKNIKQLVGSLKT